jgi:hypothetical protein
MTYYQKLIQTMDPTCNARHVEAFMRSEHGTLDHLPHETFLHEIQIAKACEIEMPGLGEHLAQSYGL